MHHPARHGGRCGAQGLSQHLAAKHLRAADIAAFTAKQVDLQLLELEEIQQVVNSAVHDKAPLQLPSTIPRRQSERASARATTTLFAGRPKKHRAQLPLKLPKAIS